MRWSGGGAKRRDDVYRVDRELAQMKFFAGEALKKSTRTRFQPSHQVYIEGDWIKFRLYDTVIAERHLVTGALKFRHGGWVSHETGKDIIPLFRRYFGGHLSMFRDKDEYWIARNQGSRIMVGERGVTMTPRDFGVWEIVDQEGERWVWDLSVQQVV